MHEEALQKIISLLADEQKEIITKSLSKDQQYIIIGLDKVIRKQIQQLILSYRKTMPSQDQADRHVKGILFTVLAITESETYSEAYANELEALVAAEWRRNKDPNNKDRINFLGNLCCTDILFFIIGQYRSFFDEDFFNVLSRKLNENDFDLYIAIRICTRSIMADPNLFEIDTMALAMAEEDQVSHADNSSHEMHQALLSEEDENSRLSPVSASSSGSNEVSPVASGDTFSPLIGTPPRATIAATIQTSGARSPSYHALSRRLSQIEDNTYAARRSLDFRASTSSLAEDPEQPYQQDVLNNALTLTKEQSKWVEQCGFKASIKQIQDKITELNHWYIFDGKNKAKKIHTALITALDEAIAAVNEAKAMRLVGHSKLAHRSLNTFKDFLDFKTPGTETITLRQAYAYERYAIMDCLFFGQNTTVNDKLQRVALPAATAPKPDMHFYGWQR